MSDLSCRKYRTPTALAKAAVFGQFLKSDNVYELCDPECDVVAVVDTTRLHGPTSRWTVWVVHVQPGHRWSSEVAQEVWELLDWDEITDDVVDPSEVDVEGQGWWCNMKVEIEY